MAKSLQPDIRENYIHDRFVIIAPGRSKRPRTTKSTMKKPAKKEIEQCVFCPENIDKEKELLELEKNLKRKNDTAILNNINKMIRNIKKMNEKEEIIKL